MLLATDLKRLADGTGCLLGRLHRRLDCLTNCCCALLVSLLSHLKDILECLAGIRLHRAFNMR